MGRKNRKARNIFIPSSSDLSIEFNPQPVKVISHVLTGSNFDPMEAIYTWFVLCVIGILVLPGSLMFLVTNGV